MGGAGSMPNQRMLGRAPSVSESWGVSKLLDCWLCMVVSRSPLVPLASCTHLPSHNTPGSDKPQALDENTVPMMQHGCSLPPRQHYLHHAPPPYARMPQSKAVLSHPHEHNPKATATTGYVCKCILLSY